VEDLKEPVQEYVVELGFNLDEVDISDWEARKVTTVVAPATIPGQTIHHEISRTLNYISVIACISAAEKSLTPYIVASQAPMSLRERLKKQGVRFGADFVLRSNPKSYINAEIFLDYIQMVLIPNLVQLRKLAKFAEETGVLLMDHCPSDHTIDLLTEARMRVITFALYTTEIFHILDVTLFGVLKR
jgi:hypothetical protein